MKLQKREVVGRLQLLITTLFWGTSFMFVKIVQEYVPPTVLMAYRFTIATAILVVIYFRRLKQIDWGYLWRGGLIGIFMFGGFVLQTYGLNTTSPGTNAFLTASYCVITPFLFWMINKIRPSIWNFAAAFICLIGIGLVSIQDNLQISAGDLITLAGGVLFAAQIVATSIFTQKRDPIL
ncbi:MAG: DMT family transporter, partial [Clostridia bacterium]